MKLAMVATGKRLVRGLLLLTGLGVVSAQAQDVGPAEEPNPLAAVFPDGRHLLSLSYSRIDAFDNDFDVYLATYSYAYDRRFRFTVQAPYTRVSDLVLDPSRPDVKTSFSGVGDAAFLLQYDPTANLSANAFVPDTLGLTLGLQAPTGDVSEGLGQDAWVGRVGGGWLVDFFRDSWLTPAINYSQSFNEGASAIEVQRVDLEVGAYWLFRNATWVGVIPNVGYDWVNEGWRTDLSIVAGKAWLNGFAVDLSWGRLDRIDAFARRDDRQLFLGVSYQFGKPPRSGGS